MIEGVGKAGAGPLLSSITGPRQGKPAGGASGDFASVLAEGARGVDQQLKNADAVSMQAMAGDASTREVAEAVMSAEQSLQTSIAIRDKLVTAFLDISRMQI